MASEPETPPKPTTDEQHPLEPLVCSITRSLTPVEQDIKAALRIAREHSTAMANLWVEQDQQLARLEGMASQVAYEGLLEVLDRIEQTEKRFAQSLVRDIGEMATSAHRIRLANGRILNATLGDTVRLTT